MGFCQKGKICYIYFDNTHTHELGDTRTQPVKFGHKEKTSTYWVEFFLLRESFNLWRPLLMIAPNDCSSSSDQDTNQFLV